MLTIIFRIHKEGAVMELHDPDADIHSAKGIPSKRLDPIMAAVVKATKGIPSFMGQEAELFFTKRKPKKGKRK